MDSLSEERGPSTIDTFLADESDKTVSENDTKYAAPDLDHDSDTTAGEDENEEIPSYPQPNEPLTKGNENGFQAEMRNSVSNSDSESDFYDAQEDLEGRGGDKADDDNSSLGSDPVDKYATVPQFYSSQNNNASQGDYLQSNPASAIKDDEKMDRAPDFQTPTSNSEKSSLKVESDVEENDAVSATSSVTLPSSKISFSPAHWVSFDDEPAIPAAIKISNTESKERSQPTPQEVSKKDWVKFEQSPQVQRRTFISSQSIDTVSCQSEDVMSGDDPSIPEDRNSIVTSSHGSITSSKDDVSNSYQQLESPVPSVGSQKEFPKERYTAGSERYTPSRNTNWSSPSSPAPSTDAASEKYTPLQNTDSYPSSPVHFAGGTGSYTPLQNTDSIPSSPVLPAAAGKNKYAPLQSTDSAPSSPVRTIQVSQSPTSSSPTVRSSESPDKKESWVKFEEEVLGTVSGSSSPFSSPEHHSHKQGDVSFDQAATMPTGAKRSLVMDSVDHHSRNNNQSDVPYSVGDGSVVLPVKHSKGNPFLADLYNQGVQPSPSSVSSFNSSSPGYQLGLPSTTATTPQKKQTWETFDETDAPQSYLSSPIPMITQTSTMPSSAPLPKQEVAVPPGDSQLFPPLFEAHFPQVQHEQSASVRGFSATAEVQYSNTHVGSKNVPMATVVPVVQTVGKVSSSSSKHSEIESALSGASEFVDEFPRNDIDPLEGWSLMVRYPDKKKLAGSREWRLVHIKLVDGNLLQLYKNKDDRQPYREIPIQCSYEFSPIKLQAHDQHGKIHTIKLLYVSFREKRRFGFGGKHKKLSMSEQLLKIGSTDYEQFKSFVHTVMEALMRLSAFKDHGAHYQQDFISAIISDSYRCVLSTKGDVLRQSAEVSVYILSFLSGKPECALGLNDIQVKGAEVVTKRDIIPNKFDEWIKMENTELHKCANKNVFVESRFIRFNPMDGCRFKLMSFNVRPQPNPELPLLVKASLSGEDWNVEVRVDILVPVRPPKQVFAHYQCQNISIRIPLPQSLYALFRKKRRMGYHSVKAVTRNPEQIKKGSTKPILLEVSVGSAKYEHAYKSIVWRIDQLPNKAKGVSTTHILKCNIDLRLASNPSAIRSSLPTEFHNQIQVEYTNPHTTASHTTVRSLAIDSEKPTEKSIKYNAHYEYIVDIDNKYIMGPDVDEQMSGAECNCVIQ